MKLPTKCNVVISNCPLMIVSQASEVIGFVTAKMIIQTIKLPYACENCNTEEIRLITCGKEYEYAKGGLPARIELPEHLDCPKCKQNQFEPDVIVGKTFRFLG